MLEATERITIAKPAALVRAQFADIAYHAQAAHHRGTSFVVVEDDHQHCRYDQVSGAGPVRIRQSFDLDRSDLVCQVNTLTKGAFSPGSITFEIKPVDESHSVVTATSAARLVG